MVVVVMVMVMAGRRRKEDGESAWVEEEKEEIKAAYRVLFVVMAPSPHPHGAERELPCHVTQNLHNQHHIVASCCPSVSLFISRARRVSCFCYRSLCITRHYN